MRFQYGWQEKTSTVDQGRINPADERNTGEKVMEYMEMVRETKEFANSPRGKFIQAQALYYGIKKLCEVEGILREESNISDMKYLLDVLYPGYEKIFDQIEGTIR